MHRIPRWQAALFVTLATAVIGYLGVRSELNRTPPADGVRESAAAASAAPGPEWTHDSASEDPPLGT